MFLLQVLLAMRANVEDRGMKGDCTPLMEAASAGHTDIVKLLISHCADVNAQSSSGVKTMTLFINFLRSSRSKLNDLLLLYTLPLIRNF